MYHQTGFVNDNSSCAFRVKRLLRSSGGWKEGRRKCYVYDCTIIIIIIIISSTLENKLSISVRESVVIARLVRNKSLKYECHCHFRILLDMRDMNAIHTVDL